MKTDFSPCLQITAFAALQAYVEQGLNALPVPPRRVWVDLHDTDAVSQICFHGYEIWIGVSYFRSIRPIQQHERGPSRFTLVHRDKIAAQMGNETTSEPQDYLFHGDFFQSGVAQVGDAIIELLRKSR